jgi:uncharacterized protein
MKYSKYNIFSKIRNSENHFIINLLTGNADILEPQEAIQIQELIGENKTETETGDIYNQLVEKGYLSDEAEEKKLYRTRYLDFLDSRENDEIQLFFVTNYTCNFACSYCYQDQYFNPLADLKNETIDAFFNYIKREFSLNKKYITVFGGEPLLNNPAQKEKISYLVSKATEENIDLSFVTNGYTLESYTDILKKGNIREVQVTLDGTGPVHNARRFLKGGNGTFDDIVRGIDSCLRNKITVNLRMVIDNDNINNLPEFARFAIEKGWTRSPWFKTQLGRNYELHHCQTTSGRLFSRLSMFEKIHELTLAHPHILEFYKPAYSVSKFLAENGKLPDPLFDSCPACKTEWAFDYTGRIYSCTATVGKEDESLGTFYPEVHLNSKRIAEWERRDVTSIPECRDCSLQLACGGGCGSVAKNRTGSTCSTDCRPVKELLEIGFSAYFEQEDSRNNLTIQTIDYQS